jgi:alkanesulfonate monooxygenase SsuD/methylene tetrahydromethanopterin reductase-like flavin-dependent oxidoreductase (luciferase family)
VRPDALARGIGQMGLDPIVQLASLAAVTSRITLVATISATFADPFTVARQLSSLEHLAGPRIGWNLVTSLGGDANHTAPRSTDSAGRWRRAEEFLDVVESLRDSFRADALVIDRDSGDFADPGLVRSIDHDGENFAVAGPLTTPSVRAGRLPLLQAGDSDSGRAFAARHADMVFCLSPRPEISAELRTDLAVRAEVAGRGRGTVAVLPGLSLFLASTRAEAWALYVSAEGHAGADDGDDGQLAGRIDRAEQGGRHWTVIGTPADAVTAIEERAVAGSIDGFIAFPGGSLGSARLLVDEVMPTLRERGLVG